ncbi:hypothetical protein C4D60_Mb01t16530 [Musa balbisiana]|uniref:ZF-HD dimerization-type domain-containing protein n=1 Tax=Musa balbisiana TaxID=52838 RepID=A0A4S8JMP0_MUSBA|nr:hypothetical protein C4D60_Mb01t16530 [Musa balbisiana]
MDLSGHEKEIPIPINSSYFGGHGQAPGHSSIHDTPPIHHSSNDTASPVSTDTREDHHNAKSFSTKKGVVVKYRECLKNHAASIGGNATDGCGEFMPSGEEGTLEALKCSACSCHRNFHRKEAEGEPSCDCFQPIRWSKMMGAFGYSPASRSFIPRATPHSMIMPLGAMQASESDEMEGVVVKYRECLKNHAASIGGNATDGCGEFMPSGEEGTLEALKCSACSCHRNFHRKEAEGEPSCDCFQPIRWSKAR